MSQRKSEGISRRRLLQSATGAAAATALGTSFALGDRDQQVEQTVATKKQIKQSLVEWCYKKYWNIDQMCRLAKRLGLALARHRASRRLRLAG